MAYPATLDSFSVKTDSVDDVLADDVNALQVAVVAIETELGTDPAGSLTDLATRLAVALSAAGLLNFKASAALTIASGAITATQNWHRVDTESSAATDNLDTITAGADGQVLVIRSTNDARDIVIRHGVGNIVCNGGGNVTLGLTSDLAILIYDDNLDLWLCQGFVSLAGANTWTGAQTWSAAETHKYAALTGNTTLDATHSIVGVDATSGNLVITLPSAAGITGRTYSVMKIDSGANTVTVTPDGSETINGAGTLVLSSQFDDCRLVSNGTNWLAFDGA